MPLIADANGVINGKITIPANVPAGTKRVSFVGAGGSHGAATFTGSGTVVSEVRRIISTVRQTFFDPLAQTFSLDAACQISAVDLWFKAKGDSDIIVQIREVESGVPASGVIGEVRVKPADISTLTAHTRLTFPAPIFLFANTQYALVAMCDDAVSELRMAELGKFDRVNQRWVTSQPYTVGVLLSSSNNATWTPHQDRDLTFRLHRAVYTQSDKSVVLGTVAVVNATDLMVSALVDEPGSQTSVQFQLSIPGGQVVTVSSGQPVRLAAPVTGNVTVTARMFGDADLGPSLFPGTELIVGTVNGTDSYVSRAIKGGTGVRVKVIFDALIPGGSSVGVQFKGADVGDTWATVPFVGSAPGDNGFYEITHEVTGVTEAMVQIKLNLTGNTAARPRVKNLRFMTI